MTDILVTHATLDDVPAAPLSAMSKLQASMAIDQLRLAELISRDEREALRERLAIRCGGQLPAMLR